MKESIIIKPLESKEATPYDLLLLADPSKEIVKEYVQRGDCFVAELNDKTVGVYVLLKTRPETIELVNIAVDEAYHNQGVGRLLLEDAFKRASELGAKVMEVGTGNSGISQLAFYQKNGFRITGIDRDFFIKHYDEEIHENGIQCRDMIRMSLDLSSRVFFKSSGD
jgi:ribosomal protein S18 acetylase RimI-like enzyme